MCLNGVKNIENYHKDHLISAREKHSSNMSLRCLAIALLCGFVSVQNCGERRTVAEWDEGGMSARFTKLGAIVMTRSQFCQCQQS
jgi:hypothetical protein